MRWTHRQTKTKRQRLPKIQYNIDNNHKKIGQIQVFTAAGFKIFAVYFISWPLLAMLLSGDSLLQKPWDFHQSRVLQTPGQRRPWPNSFEIVQQNT